MPDDPSKREPEIADVDALFGDVRPAPAPTPIPGVGAAPAGDEYAIEGDEPDDVPTWSRAPKAPPARPAKPRAEPDAPAPPRAPAAAKARVSDDDAPASRRRREPVDDDVDDEPEPRRRPAVEDGDESPVDEVWTRWGEWGPTVLRVAAAGVATVVLTYWLGGLLGIGWAFLILILGLAATVALSYPIAVTLERPVRMTPEQAVKDFYGAASHHFPHYRRMWLLLSNEGRDSREFDSFATFRTYWQHRMAKLRGSRVKSTTPLAFAVTEFKSDKSAGETELDAKYAVVVRARGDDATLTEVRIATSLVRGPDKMWYLDLGTLPEPARTA